MILFKIIGVFWLSISSMFSYGSKESSESNIVEGNSYAIQKNIGYRYSTNYYYLGVDELSNSLGYTKLLEYLVEDARGDGVDFLNSNSWYYDYYFQGYVCDASTPDVMSTTVPTNIRWRYDGGFLYFFFFTGSTADWNIFGCKLWCYESAFEGAVYCMTPYQFGYPGASLDIPLSYFNSNNKIQSLYIAYPHYITNPPTSLVNNFWYIGDAIGGQEYGESRYDEGYYNGYNTGKSIGEQEGYNSGYGNGYGAGYNVGYSEGAVDTQDDPYINAIFTGILNVALLPVNVFLSILNFEVFGINVSGFVSGLLTVSIVIIIFRFLFGGKKND